MTKENQLFTPIDYKTKKRIKIDIIPQETPRGEIATFAVMTPEGKTYHCVTAPCSLSGCICDAIIFYYPNH